MLDWIVKAVKAQRPDDPKKNGVKSWWRWPLMMVLVLAGMAVGAWLLKRNSRELAKLRHERHVREIEAENDAALVRVDLKEKEVADTLREVDKSMLRIKDIDLAIAEAEKRYAETNAKIDRITWDDLPRASD